MDSNQLVAKCENLTISEVNKIQPLTKRVVLLDKNDADQLEQITENHRELEKLLNNSRETVDRMRTRDLICWSFQIANGMNHLANKKVYYYLIFLSFS